MLAILIEKILAYGEHHLALNPEDINYYRNVLLLKFGLSKPYKGVINLSEISSMANPSLLIKELEEALAVERLPHLSMQDPEAIIIDILGMMTPIPSVVSHCFNEEYKKGPEKAIKYLYDLSVANNYIQEAKVAQNIRWRADYGQNYFQMTINLAKPEKDNKEVAKLIQKGGNEDKYPSCQLCLENVGFGGSGDTPPRQNLRAVPLQLDKEDWYLQFSPFVYYQDHVIVISKDHKPMTITPRIFSKLVAFVDQFPHFFIGSNSDLPIVGGSILNHEHFQGGARVMPVFEARDRYVLKHKMERKIKISIVEWDSNIIRLVTPSKSLLLEVATKISEKWLNYTNVDLEIIPFTGDVRHAAVTPIVAKEKKNYVMYLVLRNNRTNEAYPDGIFHAHPEYHNIKKEGIGLIEQMGTFILPARLKSEFNKFAELYASGVAFETVLRDYPQLQKHEALIRKVYADKVNSDDLLTVGRNFASDVCKEVLKNTACFKDDERGQKAFIDFLKL